MLAISVVVSPAATEVCTKSRIRAFIHDTPRSDKLPDIMRDFLIAIVFLVGTVLFLGGELFFGHLFSTPTAAIGIGAVLCFLAAVAKDRIDRDMTLF
jgi:hypothetical protein